MPPSQLKRLKASLREQGLVGPTKSKKQKRKLAKEAQGERRVGRTEALQKIREELNPFDLKHNPRGPKFHVTTDRPQNGRERGVQGRPGVARALGEERRRQTLLVEMQRRNKVGGILDNRFGEDDPNMTVEEKMMERFAREKIRSHKRSSMFDLEEDEPTEGLTHRGQKLTFDEPEVVDDFQEDVDTGSDASSERGATLEKRLRMLDEDDEADEPERKKTKKEVMEEIIAKSKLHKLVRQEARDADDQLREDLDKELPELQALLMGDNQPVKQVATTADGITSMAGKERDAFEKDFDMRIRQLVLDKRSAPADRTKTEEEKAEEQREKLRELEEERQRKMAGKETDDEAEDEDGDDEELDEVDGVIIDGVEDGVPEAEMPAQLTKRKPSAAELGFDDEDDFVIDDDLVASGSELELDNEDSEADSEAEESVEADEQDDEDEFAQEFLNKEAISQTVAKSKEASGQEVGDDGLPFTFSCPQSYGEIVTITDQYTVDKLPVIIQRVRALHHPSLGSTNKEKLGRFAASLVDFISYYPTTTPNPSYAVVDSVIRHIHSMAKTTSNLEVSAQFRHHLKEISQTRPLSLKVGDLILLTAIGTTFRTSDLWHQVVNPAMLTMGRFLYKRKPKTVSDYLAGVVVAMLCLDYQRVAKRYVPEVMVFCLNTLLAVAPVELKGEQRFVVHPAKPGMRIRGAQKIVPGKPDFENCRRQEFTEQESLQLRVSLLSSALIVLETASDLWHDKIAYIETFEPALAILKHLTSTPSRSQLSPESTKQMDRLSGKMARTLQSSALARRPLQLHHHRPLAIKTYVPKFEDEFNPDRHYDANKERTELAKLKKEHRRERKGAMRELRKDGSFMAREKLRMKKARDEAYERKFKRLVADIQGEEGREANEYAREKGKRTRANKRR